MEYPGYKKMELRELQLLQLEVMKTIHKICVKHDIKYYMIGGTLLGAIRHKGFIPWDDDIDIAMMRSDYEKFMQIFSCEFSSEKYFLQCYGTDKDFQPAMQRVCIKDTILDIPSEYHLRNCKNTYIDIFPLDNVPDSSEERTKHIAALKNIDRLFFYKLYHVYPWNSKAQILLKKTLAFALRLIPLSYLQRKRVEAMSQFKNVDTKCVASTVSKYGYAKQIMDRSIYGVPQLYKFEDTEFYGVEDYNAYLTHLFSKRYMELPPENKREVPRDVYIKL